MSGSNGSLEAVELAKDGEVVALHAIEISDGAGSSTQPEPTESELWTPTDTIAPPQDLAALARLTDYSSIRETCIGVLVRNVVGLGWDLDVWEGHDDAKKEITDARALIDALARRDRRLDRPSFTDLLSAVRWDYEECGNGALEVSRNKNTGKIDGLYHAPGEKVRRMKNRQGYVIGENESLVQNSPQRREFYNFGEKVEYDAKGRPQRRLRSGKSWGTNELIVFRRYTSESRDYGLPRDISMVVEYAAARFLNEWTASFFEGSGTPPKVIFVAGTEGKDGKRVHFTVPTATVNRIQQALKSDSKPGNRVAIIPVPPGTQVHAETLGEMSERDLTFNEFKKVHRSNVRSSMGPLSPIFVGDVDDSGRYTAEVQRAITLEQVFDPDQRGVEDRLWTTLLVDLALPELRFVFKRLAVEGDAVKREAAVAMSEVGAITKGEFRKAHGYGPLPEELYGEGVNDELLNAGKPRGAEDRVDVAATQDQRGLRPGIGGRMAKSGAHGVEHVEEVVTDLEAELVAMAESDDEG